MGAPSQLSPDLAQGVLQLARALLASVRAFGLYPPEHPAVAQAVVRLSDAIRQTSPGALITIGVTPQTLLIEGAPAEGSRSIGEAAAFLHECDILQFSFIGTVPADAVSRFLKVLTLEAGERRRRGGPAKIWAADGHASIEIQQIDYEALLHREQGDAPEPAKRDDLWKSIVQSIAGGQKTVFDEDAQRRLLAIAGSPNDIGELAAAVMAPKCTMDGSPMITSQAATVLAAFRHLTSIVSVMAPERIPEVMGHLATASTRMDPHVVMQVLQTEEDGSDQLSVVRGIAGAFDDVKVAQLLATALALEGKASDRLATIFDTIAPDEDRKRRVLTLTRNMLSEHDFGKSGQFQVLWTSMEELLVSYNDKPFVSESYRSALDEVGARAQRAASGELPPELGEWMDTLGQDNVRRLSVRLLIDLLTIETDAARATEIATDMAALAEDLLMAGAYPEARSVASALVERAQAVQAIGRDAARLALDRLGESNALRETGLLIADVDDESWSEIDQTLKLIGPVAMEALKPLVMVEAETRASVRATDVIVGYGVAVVSRVGGLTGDSRWFVQKAAAQILGRIGAAEAVPLLQPLLRRSDSRVAREAISALANINDPSAARAIHTVLRAATGDLRRAVIDALVLDRDPRVIPMLVRIVDESQPLGKDHQVVIETISALGQVGTSQAVPTIAGVIQRRSFLGRRKLRALKTAGVDALARIGGTDASAALENAGRRGDRLLRKIVSARMSA